MTLFLIAVSLLVLGFAFGYLTATRDIAR